MGDRHSISLSFEQKAWSLQAFYNLRPEHNVWSRNAFYKCKRRAKRREQTGIQSQRYEDEGEYICNLEPYARSKNMQH